ncbi:MAG: DUF368 domain-containing protein [Christensenellales bacterium]
MNNTKNNKISAGMWLLRVAQGAIVGGGAILPGISGGVLLVTFGIYQPMMALLSRPIRSFSKYYKLFIPFLIGWLIGFFALAHVVSLLFKISSSLTVCLFVGLIAGTLPSLFKDAAKQGTSTISWAGFSVCLAVSYGFLAYLQKGETAVIEPNIWWYVFCGAVWGLSLVIPGLSSSSVLIFMGLYQPMTAGISAFDLGVVPPLIAGIGITIALLARPINSLFENHNSVACHSVLGFVIASTLLIIPTEYGGAAGLLFSVTAFIAGFGTALIMNKYKAAPDEISSAEL